MNKAVFDQVARDAITIVELRKELDATSAMLSAAERDLQATQRDLDEANATIGTLRRQLAYSKAANMELRRKLGEMWLPDMNGLRMWWGTNELFAKDHTIHISKDGVTVDFLLPEGYALCCRVTPQPSPDVEFVPDEQPGFLHGTGRT